MHQRPRARGGDRGADPPRRLDVEGEVERLLPDPPTVRLPVFWIDAVAPLDESGEEGVGVALRLALALDATCIVEDD